MDITIYHNPACGTSRNTLALIRAAGIEPADIKAIADPTDAAAAAAVETPVYRREQGLWPHQKYFAHLALERHRLGGARLVLADQVGLGKTVQLAMADATIETYGPARQMRGGILIGYWDETEVAEARKAYGLE